MKRKIYIKPELLSCPLNAAMSVLTESPGQTADPHPENDDFGAPARNLYI